LEFLNVNAFALKCFSYFVKKKITERMMIEEVLMRRRDEEEACLSFSDLIPSLFYKQL
jgi:hypothetical protein